jgi:hypothetical protein
MVAVSVKRSRMPPHTLIIWSDVGAGFTAKAFSRTRIGSGASDPSDKGLRHVLFSHVLVMSCSLTCIEDARARVSTTSTLVAAKSWRRPGRPNACDSGTLSRALDGSGLAEAISDAPTHVDHLVRRRGRVHRQGIQPNSNRVGGVWPES